MLAHCPVWAPRPSPTLAPHAQARRTVCIAGNAEIPPSICWNCARPGPGRTGTAAFIHAQRARIPHWKEKENDGTAHAPQAASRPLPGAQPGDATGRPWGHDGRQLTGTDTACQLFLRPSIGRGPVLRWHWGGIARGTAAKSRRGWAAGHSNGMFAACWLCVLARSLEESRADLLSHLTD